jgi:sugar/nucleoside kinase (ribokinase family)
MSSHSPDYLVIGHVCRDLSRDGPRLGGTATFTALTAQALALRPAIVTSAPVGAQPLLQPLHPIPLSIRPAGNFTTFENAYTPQRRIQTLWARAEQLTLSDVPIGWRSAPIIHLAPVADEVDPSLVSEFPGALIGVTPQGWMRQWDGRGRVAFRSWQRAAQVLARADAVIFSIEDVQEDESLVGSLARRARILVVTRGENGCTLFVEGVPQSIPAPKVAVVDPTGAGDIFAAAFLIQFRATDDPPAAARFATWLASDSVTRAGLESIPQMDTIATARGDSGQPHSSHLQGEGP